MNEGVSRVTRALALKDAVGEVPCPAVALVLDGLGLADLGVIRSLGRAGLEVWLAGPDAAAPECSSRYVRRFHRVPSVVRDADLFTRKLHDWVAAQPQTVVMFCTGDRMVGAVSPRRADLPANLIHHIASEQLVTSCLSKAKFSKLSSEIGLPVPQTRVCRDEDALKGAIREFGEAFIKPSNRHRLWTNDPAARQASAGMKGFVVRGMNDVPPVVRTSLKFGYGWVAQQFVAGGANCLYSVHAYRDRTGSWTQCFVGQKLRTAPPRDGVGVLARSAWDPEAAELAEQILTRMDYRGYALLQFKRDVRSGKLYLLEINPRYSTWCELAERAGVNLPVVAFLDALDALPEAPHLTQRDGVYWWDAAGDWSNLRRREAAWGDRLAGLVPPPAFPALARLAVDDPRPGLARLPIIGPLVRRRWPEQS